MAAGQSQERPREQSAAEIADVKQRVADWLARDLSIPEVYRELQLLALPRLVIDKSPSYAESPDTLRRIDEWFTSSYPIVLVRHPCAVIESYVRNRIGVIGPPGAAHDAWQQAEHHWVTTNHNLCQFLDAAPRPWHLVRYEELVTTPERTLRALCVSLGVDYDPAVLTPYQGRRMIDGAGDPNLHEHDRIGVAAGRLARPCSHCTGRHVVWSDGSSRCAHPRAASERA